MKMKILWVVGLGMVCGLWVLWGVGETVIPGPSPLTPADIAGAGGVTNKSSVTLAGITNRPAVNMVILGDSLSVPDATSSWAYHINARSALNGITILTNAAVGGNAVSNMVTQYMSSISNTYAPKVTGIPTVLALFGGVNDSYRESADVIWNDISNIWTMATADGFSVLAFTPTVYSGTTTAGRKRLEDVGSLVRRYSDSVWRLVDTGAMFGDALDTNVHPDGVHLQTNAAAALAQHVEWVLTQGSGYRPVFSSPWNSRVHAVNGTASDMTITGTTALDIVRFNGLQFNETTDDNVGIESLSYPVGNQSNSTWWGYSALYQAPGAYNNAQGYGALRGSTGSYNNAQGYAALCESPGSHNNAQGHSALYQSPGSYNVAQGSSALLQSAGSHNTAQGYTALYKSAGSCNTAQGEATIYQSPGSFNVAQGYYGLFQASGSYNTAQGSWGLYLSPGSYNNAQGYYALTQSAGSRNNAQGAYALYQAPGSDNFAGGYQAGYHSGGLSNVFVGVNAGYTSVGTNYYTNAIAVGANSVPLGNNSMVLGNSATTNTEIKGNVGINSAFFMKTNTVVAAPATGFGGIYVDAATNYWFWHASGVWTNKLW